jgi:hypothetical protein
LVQDKNSYPYYDDFNEDKKFLQIMFNPARAVQARELSQLQSIIQNQIDRFGKHVFKEGSMVIAGESAIDTAYPYVKLQGTFNSLPINLTNFEEKRIVGLTSGTVATVLQTLATDQVNPDTIFVKLETGVSSQTISCSTTNGSKNVTTADTSGLVVGSLISGSGIPANTFISSVTNSTTFTIVNAATATASPTLTVTTSNTFTDNEQISTVSTGTVYNAQLVSSNATGLGSKAQIKRGIYFVRGYFCLVEDQTIILDAYSDTPSYKIGLSINDSFVSHVEDESLNDPAAGFTNFNAKGADRYKIDLIFSKIDINSPTTENFVELIRVKDGLIQKLVTRPEYSELEKTLARRTFDESGDYTVRHFPLQVKEHLNDGSNNGVFTSTDGGDSTKLVAALDAGKAYVKGFEIELQQTKYIEFDKSREFRSENNFSVNYNFGNYIDVDTYSGLFDVSSYETVDLHDTAAGGGSVIGSAKVRGIEYLSGTINDPTAKYRIYLFDIIMDTGTNGVYPFSTVRSIVGSSAQADLILVSGQAVLNLVDNSIGLIPIPEYAVKTVSDVGYIVSRYFSGIMTTTTITFTANTNEFFQSGNNFNYIITITSASGTATGNGYSNGDMIDITDSGNSAVLGGSPTGRQVTLTIPDISGSTVAVIAKVRKTNTTQKSKTLNTRTQTIAHASDIQLDRSDIFKIVSITDLTTSGDITNQYVLDNGQRDNYYDRGSLKFLSTYTAPAANIEVEYQFFSHGNGDYFSVDSYDGVIDYGDIPVYNSKTSGQVYDLINCLDFRPRINDAGTGFTGTGGIISEFVAPSEDITFDYDYYLGRIDKIFLSKDGEFKIITGSSAISPTAPNEPDNGMVLYQIAVPPYTFDAKDVIVKFIDNKRYTMRDIGRIEKRVQNLEYYTALSLLEKDTADMFIDDGTGVNRFKNGFIVDNFKSHKVGDVALKEYECSVDPANGVLRPQFFNRNVKLELITGDSSNYVKTGDLITLPYTTEELITQPFASKTENVNPYNIFNWIGSVELTPPSDDWFETQMTPDIIASESDDGLANALASLNGQVVWNDWETTWIGQELSRVPINTEPTISTTQGTGTRPHGGFMSANSWARSVGRVPNEIIGFFVRESIGDTVGGVLLTAENTTGRGGTGAVGIFRDAVTREVGQTRTGYVTSVVPKTVTEVIDSKILDITTIPFMRPITIEFRATKLKPNSVVYPFFDNVNISQYVTPTGGSLGGTLITNANGEVSGSFDVPNTNDVKFRTGSRLFKLSDSPTNNLTTTNTSASKLFIASGAIQTRQNTVISTRTAELVTTTVTEDRLSVGTNIEETRQIMIWSDPLAQTFLIDSEGGVFLSKIDIFFATKDSQGIPVTLQIRNVTNGYPAQQIVPFSEVVLNPDDVDVSNDASVATSFTFPSPVYLQANQEYCFVLLANSNEYNIHVAQLGGTDTLTGEFISQQPYAGVMFKSQNASTWTAAQEEDIKFTIHRCVFNTGVTGQVILKNADLTPIRLPDNCLITTNTSNVVTVYRPNHGLSSGQTSTFSGFSGTLNGIPSSELNDTHTVTVTGVDFFTITVTTNATSSGATGGTNIFCTVNYQMDVANVNIQHLTFPETSLGFAIKTTDIDGNLSSNFGEIAVGENLQLIDSQTILSPENEGSDKSMIVRNTLATTVDNLSPVIDTARMSFIAVGNRINSTFTNELQPQSGDAVARYITKQVTLADDATALHVYFAAARPANSEIRAYVKMLRTDSEENFDDQPYVQMDAVKYPVYSDSNFFEYQFILDNQEPFTIFAIKLVMGSLDTADVPLIKDFRGIATGS